VRLYTVSNCSGSPAATGSAAAFASPGLTPAVPDNSTRTFYATATDAAGNTSSCSTSSITYVEDSTAPSAPVVSDSDPDSPANDNSPEIKGSAESGSTVRLYTTPDCTGSPAATGSAASFASPGLSVAVSDNTSTTYRAATTDAAGNASSCSTSSITYVEDSTNPDTPSITDTDPDSPANDNAPEVKGSAESGSTVTVYKTSDCTGGVAATGSAAAFADPGLTVSVTGDATTQLSAKATDAAGNASACSSAASYTEDSTAPSAPSISGTDPASPANDNSPRVKGTAGAGAPATVKLYENAACSGSPDATGTVGQFTGAGISTAVPSDSTTRFSARASDAAGNDSPCSSAITYVEDSTAPAIEIRTPPEGARYPQRQAVDADFSCADPAGSGLASGADGCSGTVADGQPIDTVTLGSSNFIVTARDAAGNTSQASRPYTVIPAAKLTLACAPTPVLIGQKTTCTMTVRKDSLSAGADPRGTVALTSNTGGDVGSCALVPSSAGAAVCTLAYAPKLAGSGAHELSATYGGDADNAPTGATFALDVLGVSVKEGSTLRVRSSNGIASLPVTCARDGGTCTGTVQLVNGAVPKGRTAKKPTVFGKARFSIRRGRRGAVKIQLSRTGRALLLRKRNLGVHAAITSRGANRKTLVGKAGLKLSSRR
jgi:hypothetical protein